MSKTALILLGHGSHISPNTAGIVWEQVDRLRGLGVADEITAAFWKEDPAFHQVLSTVAAKDITLVPLFTADGYFTQTVIPAEMGLAGKSIRYAPSLANHAYLSQVLHQRVEDALQAYDLPAQATAVVVIGHGTRRNPDSRAATEKQVALLRAADLTAEVFAAYLDDQPAIPEIYGMTRQPNLIVIPYFLALGSHTTQDVPSELGLEVGQATGIVEGKRVTYTPPVGISTALTDIVLDLVQQAGAVLYEAHNQAAWGSFPQVGCAELVERVQGLGGLTFGQLWLSPQFVCHVDDTQRADLTVLDQPAALRRWVRDDPFRPLSTSLDLPRGWKVEIPPHDAGRLFAVVETVYPAAAAAWTLPRCTLAEVAARQQGVYATLGSLTHDECASLVDQICQQCARYPAWFSGSTPAGNIPCSEACNWWMSRALETRKA